MTHKERIEILKLGARLFITIVFFVVGLVLVFGNPDEGMRGLGAGFLGTIIGYWLK